MASWSAAALIALRLAVRARLKVVADTCVVQVCQSCSTARRCLHGGRDEIRPGGYGGVVERGTEIQAVGRRSRWMPESAPGQGGVEFARERTEPRSAVYEVRAT